MQVFEKMGDFAKKSTLFFEYFVMVSANPVNA